MKLIFVVLLSVLALSCGEQASSSSGTNTAKINGRTTTSDGSISIDTVDENGNHIKVNMSQNSNGQSSSVQISGNGNTVVTDQR